MKNILLPTLFIISVLALISSCNKDDVSPSELPLKQLDSITENGRLLYLFEYERDELIQYECFGDDPGVTTFVDGKLHRHYSDSVNYTEYVYDGQIVKAHTNIEPDIVVEKIYLHNNGFVTRAIVYEESDSTDYKYFYTGPNITKIEMKSSTGTSVFYLEYDDHPNPWYYIPVLDNYLAHSKNNITKISGNAFGSYVYDNEGYVFESNIAYQGHRKYYYK